MIVNQLLFFKIQGLRFLYVLIKNIQPQKHYKPRNHYRSVFTHRLVLQLRARNLSFRPRRARVNRLVSLLVGAILECAAVSKNDRPFSDSVSILSSTGDGFKNRAGMKLLKRSGDLAEIRLMAGSVWLPELLHSMSVLRSKSTR